MIHTYELTCLIDATYYGEVISELDDLGLLLLASGFLGLPHATCEVVRTGPTDADRPTCDRRCQETPTDTHETRETVRQARLPHAHAKTKDRH